MTAPWRLGEVAAANATTRRAEADAVVAADSSGRLARFRAHAATGRFSTNVAAFKILVFGDRDEIVDAHSIAVHQASGDAETGTVEYERRQGRYGVRRSAFEGLWDAGSELVYGALNTGGLGVYGEPFGVFCIVLDHPEGDGHQVVLFPGDSAQRYATFEGAVDADLARREASGWDGRGDLAVTERQTEAMTRDEDEWPAVVCRTESYLEAVIASGVQIGRVSEIRVATDHLAELRKLRSGLLAGRILTEVERAEALAYNVLRGWQRRYGSGLTGIP